jgi:hypothetical protein
MTTFIAWSIPHRDAETVLNDKGVREAIIKRWGRAAVGSLKDTFAYATYHKAHSDNWNVFHKSMNWVERQMAVNILGFRASSIMLNRVGGSIMNMAKLVAIDPKVAAEYAKVLISPRVPIMLTQADKQIREMLLDNGYFFARWKHDPFRVFGNLAEKRNMEESAAGKLPVIEEAHLRYRQLQALGTSGLAWAEMRNAIDMVKAMKTAGYSDAKAVAMAEYVTRETQNPSTAIEETGMYRRVKEAALGLVFPFLGQPAVVGDFLQREIVQAMHEKRQGNSKQAARRYAGAAVGVAASAAFTVLLRALFRAASNGLLTGEPDDDDIDREAFYLIRGAASELASVAMPVGDEIVDFPLAMYRTISTGNRKHLFETNVTETMASRVGSSAIRSMNIILQAIEEGEIPEGRGDDLIRSLNNSLGALSGLPTGGAEQAYSVGAGLAGEPFGRGGAK